MKRIFLAILFLSILPMAQASTGTISLWGLEWNHDPLTVYIKAPSDKINDIKTTLNDWSSALESASGNVVDNSEIGGTPDNKFDFTYVDSARDADIVINVQRTASFTGVLGITNPLDINGDGYFDKIRINVKLGSMGATNEDFKQNVRHEEGHALGLGHATDETDLMSAQFSSTDQLYPSDLDINAVLFIYRNDGFGLPNTLPVDIPPHYPYP